MVEILTDKLLKRYIKLPTSDSTSKKIISDNKQNILKCEVQL